MISRRWLSLMLVAAPAVAAAQAAALPTPAELRAQTARRFPQPVRVGSIVGQDVLQPTEAQRVLGRVASVRRGADGTVLIVVAFGGVLGFGARRVAVPADAMAYLGPQLALVGFTPEQAAGLPDAPDAPDMAVDAAIPLGIVRPFH